MRAYDMIEKKKRGGALTREEIDFLVHGSSVSPAFASFKNSDISLVTHLSLW